MRRGIAGLLLAALVPLAAACTSTKVLTPETERTFDSASARVLLLPPDVEVAELLANGMADIRADWTESARRHIGRALAARVGRGKAQLIAGDPALFGAESPHLQLLKLHEAVGNAILVGKLGPSPLPTLRDRFDFTLGASVEKLASDTGANYALFVFLRDSYASGGRQALMVGGIAACVATGGMFCAVPAGGFQVGFATLVDLRSGDVVWFNRLLSETGDVREAKPAAKTVETLLKGFPL